MGRIIRYKGVTTEGVFYSKIRVEKSSCSVKFISSQVNLYFLI